MNSIIQKLLEVRGINPAQYEQLVHPDFSRDTHEPALLPDAQRAAERIVASIEKAELIVLFGDYDADGVPGTAIAERLLTLWGARVTSLIPRRHDGYGLTTAAVERILALKPQVVVTIDNGTVAVEAVHILTEAGIDCIVTDHHEPHGEAVRAFALVNPKRSDSQYPFRELCGAAVIWKVLWLVARLLNRSEADVKWQMDLVGLSTIADMVPLVGENRVLAQLGLKTFERTRNEGLRSLAVSAGMPLQGISAEQIGYKIAPRINAPSRTFQEEQDGRNISLQLLVTDDEHEASRLAEQASEANTQRQSELQKALAEARTQVEAQSGALVHVIYGQDWSGGIVGLVAGRILEQTQLPTMAFSLENGEWRGSVRSGNLIDTLALLESCSDLLSRFGGHAKAGGCSALPGISPEQIFARAQEYVSNKGHSQDQIRAAQKRVADLSLFVPDISLELAEQLELLAPYGMGFPAPVFALRAHLEFVRRVGTEGAHVQCELVDGTSRVRGIWFQGPEQAVDGYAGTFLVKIKRDVYRGTARVGVEIVGEE